jgi:hypothetical protein
MNPEVLAEHKERRNIISHNTIYCKTARKGIAFETN